MRRTTVPSASTASSPATRARTVPWRSARMPPASQADEPAERRAVAGAEVHAGVEPGRARVRLQRAERHARAGADLHRRGVDLAERR